MRIAWCVGFFVASMSAVTACKSKARSCEKVTHALEPIMKELDATAAAAGARPPPSPADAASCFGIGETLRRVENAQAALALVVADDATLAKHVDTYRRHVDAWARSAKKEQAACLARDGNAMTQALSDAIQARSQLAPAANDITSYCKAP